MVAISSRWICWTYYILLPIKVFSPTLNIQSKSSGAFHFTCEETLKDRDLLEVTEEERELPQNMKTCVREGISNLDGSNQSGAFAV